MAVQYRRKHQRLVQQLVNPLLVRLNPNNTVLRK